MHTYICFHPHHFSCNHQEGFSQFILQHLLNPQNEDVDSFITELDYIRVIWA